MNPRPTADTQMKDFRRALTVKAVAAVTDRYSEEVATRLYGRANADAILKAATSPTSLAEAGPLTTVRIGPFLRSLRARSAAARLIELGSFIDLRGVASISLPRLSADFTQMAWVGEGGPAPVYSGSFGSVSLVPKKLMGLAPLTNELSNASAEAAEQIVSDLLEDSAARALDASLFSATAASALRPAGILNGITETPGTAGGGQAAMLADLKAMSAAVAAAGGGSQVVIVAALPQAIALQVLSGSDLDIPVVVGPALPSGTVIVLDSGAFASGFRADPEIDISESAVVHLEDTTPLAIGTPGSPNTVAAPVRSAWQNDLKILRCILRPAWVMRAPAIAFTESATW